VADELSFISRVWFAWVCYFRVLFDGAFAARAWGVRAAKALPAPAPAPAPAPSRATAADATSALQLLSLLQREGRLVDFLQQDVATFSDADVAAAARVVHEGCRKALSSHVTVEPVRKEEEGARVTLAAGFDADQVKLVGDVRGEPPYTGVLRHRGWRAAKIDLPRLVGEHDTHVLAPAEVELG
jgi:Domain of unknown function (DUF2760)